MGGKTGTAQKLPRKDENYLVSFIGFAPYEDPQLVIYVVVDEPNVEDQARSIFAMNIAREILEEVLPYMNIYPDEEFTGANADLGILGTDVLNSQKPENEPEAGAEPEAAPEGEPEATPEGEPEAAPEAEPEATPEGEPEATPEGEP